MSQSTTSSGTSSGLKLRLLSTRPEYQSAPTNDNPESSTYNGRAISDSRSSSRPWRGILAMQLFCLAWVAPILYLLKLNYRNHILGASAWCPKHNCWVDAFNNDTRVPQVNLAKLAAQDHTFNNVLLYVAKALEVWFGLIAGSFMYLLVMRVAESSVAIPIRLLSLPHEFPDLLSGLDGTLWTSTSGASRWLWLVLTGVFLSILSNLMGPATSTLVLPTQKWVQTKAISQGYLTDSMNSAQAPTTSGFAFIDSNCSAAEFEALQWSCATKWSHVLDSWVSSGFAAMSGPNGSLRKATSPQGTLTLTANVTTVGDSLLLWVPSRQLLQDLDGDRIIVANISNGANATQIGISEDKYQQYAAYNSSQKLQLQRSGPILGALPRVQLSGWYTIEVDQNRSILCQPNYSTGEPILDGDDNTNFTKCFQTATSGGYGWPAAVGSDFLQASGQRTVHPIAGFTVDAPEVLSNDGYDLSILVDVYGSGAAVMLPNGSMKATHEETSLPDLCLNATIPSGLECDWTHFFSFEYNQYSTSNETRAVNIITFAQDTRDNQALGIFIDYVAWYGFTTYELDAWPTSNPLGLVQTPSLDIDIADGSLPVDPLWILAAWGVDGDGGRIPANRTIAQMLHSVFYRQQYGVNIHGFDRDDDDDWSSALLTVLYLPIAQALSLMDWNTNHTTPEDSYYYDHLWLSANMYVWAYGFDSKSARLGGAVAIAGCIIAFLQCAYGLMHRRKHRSLTQIVLAALAHRPLDDFADVGDELRAQSGAHFSIHDAEDEIGGLKFQRVR